MNKLYSKSGGAISKKAIIIGAVVVLVVIGLVMFMKYRGFGHGGLGNGHGGLGNGNGGLENEPSYKIKLAGAPTWGIGADGRMTQTPASFYFKDGYLLLASDLNKAIGSEGVTIGDEDILVTNIKQFQRKFKPVSVPGVVAFVFDTPQDFAMNRWSGIPLQEGGKLTLGPNISPTYNQDWLVELA